MDVAKEKRFKRRSLFLLLKIYSFKQFDGKLFLSLLDIRVDLR